MSLVDKLRQIETRDLMVPAAGFVAAGATMLGGVAGGHIAEMRNVTNPELIGTYQLVCGWVAGATVFAPVYVADAYSRYRGNGSWTFFRDHAKLGVVLGLGSALNFLKPIVSGRLMRWGVNHDVASLSYDTLANTVRIVTDNAAYFSNILSLKSKKKQ